MDAGVAWSGLPKNLNQEHTGMSARNRDLFTLSDVCCMSCMLYVWDRKGSRLLSADNVSSQRRKEAPVGNTNKCDTVVFYFVNMAATEVHILQQRCGSTKLR